MSRRVTCGYHCTAKPVSFGRGQSAVHTAAYNARTQLMHEQSGVETRDYSKHRGSALLFEGIFAPEGAPDWARDREQLWNRAEVAERQKVNGQPARNMIVAFPHELDQQRREWLLKDFAREQFARKGMVADATMHAPDAHGDERNYHAHILLTMRRIEGGEFARTKERDWNRKEQLEEWRAAWAEKGAKALERAGYPVEAERWRHGHETLEKQRAAALARGDAEFAESLEQREATTHKGAKLSAMERRGVDVESDWLDGAKQIEARNEARAEAKAADRELAGLQAEQARELAARAAAKKPTPIRGPLVEDHSATLTAEMRARVLAAARKAQQGYRPPFGGRGAALTPERPMAAPSTPAATPKAEPGPRPPIGGSARPTTEPPARAAETQEKVEAQRAAALANAKALAEQRPALDRAWALQKLAEADKADRKTLQTDEVAEKFAEGARDQAQAVGQERKDAAFWQKQKDWKRDSAARAPGNRPVKGSGLKVNNAVTGVISGLGDFMTDFLANLGGSAQPEPPARSAGKSVAAFLMDPQERKRQQIARAAEREAQDRDRKAIENMDSDMKAGKALSSVDIGNLTWEHQDQIHTFGDDGVRRMVEDARRAAEKALGRERERE